MRRRPSKPVSWQEVRSSWAKILTQSRRFLPVMVLAILFSIISTIFTLKAPDLLSEATNLIMNGILTGIDMDKVLGVFRTIALIYGASLFLSLFQQLIMTTVTHRFTQSLRTQIAGKIDRLPMAYYHQTSTGDVLSRVTNDVDMIGQSFNQSLGTFFASITLFFGSLFMMLRTNVLMTVTAIGASLVGFILMFIIMGRSQKYFFQQQESLGAINGHIEEIFSGHTIMRAYNGESAALQTFDELNEALRSSAFRSQHLAGLMPPLMIFIGNAGYVAVCVAGASLTINGKASVGVIVAFMMYIRFFTQPLSQLAQVAQTMQAAAAAASRVFEFLEAEEMPDESDKHASLGNIRGDVSFDHVRFGYDPDRVIIHDFSASAQAGKKIAIVGPTGAGKTTLVNLLMRFYDPDEGSIRIDGTASSDVRREAVREQFCMVLQETWLFEGTIRENLAFATPGVTDDVLDRACEAVGLDYFIRTLPKRYDTVLNDKVALSQGQMQQLTIARAMIADRPMLILDEATSSVDTRTEQIIQRAMDELMKGRTSFVIAHRLSTIRNADLILVLRDGDIVESGTHEQLVADNGFYAELYNSQFES